MKVLLINGSPRREGNTFIALSEVARTLRDEGIGAEIVSIGTRAVQGCIACGKCAELGRCVFNDALYDEVREKLAGADALVVGSPVYYAGPNGSLCALLDRLFYSCGSLLAYKPAAAVAVCRRGGASATFDRLNKYFTISNMPVVSSTDGCPARRRRMPKDCRRCGCWRATWRACFARGCWPGRGVRSPKSGWRRVSSGRCCRRKKIGRIVANCGIIFSFVAARDAYLCRI